MEMQFFVKPGTDGEWFERWREWRMQWHHDLGLDPARLRWHQHGPDELAHYARAAFDIQYEFPFGWQEIEGIHNRGDFDLGRHQEYSGKKLDYFDQATNERFLPYIVETSAGADRVTLDAAGGRLPRGGGRRARPASCSASIRPSRRSRPAVFPLVKKDGMPELATALYHELSAAVPRRSTTTAAPSAGATGAWTRRARRSASRSTARPTPDGR